MANTKIAEMTIDDLKALIAEVVGEQLRNWQQRQRDTRTVEEVLAAMDRLRWTPSSGPTTTDIMFG